MLVASALIAGAAPALAYFDHTLNVRIPDNSAMRHTERIGGRDIMQELFFVGSKFSITTKSGGAYTDDCRSSPGEVTLHDSHFRSRQRSPLNAIAGSSDQRADVYFDFELGAFAAMLNLKYYCKTDVAEAVVDIPVKSQAPDVNKLQDLVSTTTSAIVNDSLSSNFSLSVFSSHDLVGDLYDPMYASNATTPAFEVDKSGAFRNAKLSNETELHYKVPKNTSAVHIFGPVTQNRCYAAFRPPPAWWNSSSPARMSTHREEVSDNEDMFWLPVDPEVEYELVIGSWQKDCQCYVGGVTSYSFFYPTLPAPDAVPQMAILVKSIEATNRSRTIALGVGIGIGVPLILLAVFLLWRRYRSRRRSVPFLDLVDGSTDAGSTLQRASSSRSSTPLDPFVDAAPRSQTSAPRENKAKSDATTGYAELLRQLDVPASLFTTSDSASTSPSSAAVSKPPAASSTASTSASSDVRPRRSPLPPPPLRERVVVQHEEDAGDAEQIRYEILPPMYREEWVQRPQSDQLTEPAAGVTRSGEDRTHDSQAEDATELMTAQELEEKEKILKL